MSSVFRFKQFEVNQEGSAMRINTDGVLLGAMADHSLPINILDIGTGTGVIALMLAQRFPTGNIEAIELDEYSAELAEQNFEHSRFSARLKVHHGAFQYFKPRHPYDLMVSNPPFFTNALQNPDKRKAIARHTNTQFFDDLLIKAAEWLHNQGSLQVIVPLDIGDYLIDKATTSGIFTLTKTIHIRSFIHNVPFRKIISLEKGRTTALSQEQEVFFTLYEAQAVYSSGYKSLLSPFFLKF